MTLQQRLVMLIIVEALATATSAYVWRKTKCKQKRAEEDLRKWTASGKNGYDAAVLRLQVDRYRGLANLHLFYVIGGFLLGVVSRLLILFFGDVQSMWAAVITGSRSSQILIGAIIKYRIMESEDKAVADLNNYRDARDQRIESEESARRAVLTRRADDIMDTQKEIKESVETANSKLNDIKAAAKKVADTLASKEGQ